MIRFQVRWSLSLTIAALGWMGTGCSQSAAPAKPSATAASPKTTDTAESNDEQSARPARRGPVTLGGGTPSGQAKSDDPATTESIVSALQPLQVLLGKWNGASRGKALIDQPEWVWDFRTDRQRPALVLKSDKGEYLREAKLTFLPDRQEYQLSAVDEDNQRRLYRGTFSQPVKDVPGDDDKLQRTYKLQLTEADPATEGERWQIVFAQQENDRYIVEVNRQRGSGPFTRLDTIHTQREGTSFAMSSGDYGEKTCVISQGLGTIAVNYKGNSYWVCCTGCKAAFEEDPERWIARYEEQKKMKR